MLSTFPFFNCQQMINNFMKPNESQPLSSFEMIKFSEDSIIMRNRNTKKLYQYYEGEPRLLPQMNILHPTISIPLIVQTGVLIQEGSISMKQVLENDRKGKILPFQQDQIINTLSPVLNAILYLHGIGVVHGSLSPSAIFLDQAGDIKVLFPAPFQTKDHYYHSSEKTKAHDLKAIALIALELLSTNMSVPETDPKKKLKTLARSASNLQGQCLFMSIFIMLNELSQYFFWAFDFLRTSQARPAPPDLKEIYEMDLVESQQDFKRNSKAEFTPPLLKHSQQQFSPKKIAQMSRKYMKADGLENKKTLQEQKKKTPLESVLRKMSNGKVGSETSPPYKKLLKDIKQTKERQDIRKIGLPFRRMRTTSKKKLA